MRAFPLHICLIPTLLLSFIKVQAQQHKPPTVIPSYLQNLPAKIYYFEDTTSVLIHDSIDGVVHVSTDEGRVWKPASGIPKGEAVALIEHPFDNNYAFVMGPGTTHRRTKDRGRTWQSFEAPGPANLRSSPLSFHIDPKYNEHIIYQSLKCQRKIFWNVCHDMVYYTEDAFTTEPKPLIEDASKCLFAHSSKEFKHDAPLDLVLCISHGSGDDEGRYALDSTRLISSTDYFKTRDVVDLGVGEKNARGILAFTIISKFAIVALKDLNKADGDNMILFVSADAQNWARAQFPHASSSSLRENAYTVLQGTTHSLAVDVLLREHSTIGTLFVSNSNGTFYVESLQNTNRNIAGFVDFETIYGVEGVGMANVVVNADSVGASGEGKILRTKMTFDDGSTWNDIVPPDVDAAGQGIGCNTRDPESCALHLHSVTTPHNFGRIFSSPAPGYVIGVGNVGSALKSYDESQTFFSSDAGLTWKMIVPNPTKYEFGGKGSVLVVVDDEEFIDGIRYSLDSGKTFQEYKFDSNLSLRAKGLVTLPDSTSQKFILLGTLARRDSKGQGNHAVVYLDFADIGRRVCDNRDFERWYARSNTGSECVMGHKQYYMRRKADVDCYVGDKFEDPVAVEENCSCTEEDYECDYNFVRSEGECIPAGPLPITAGNCEKGQPGEQFLGSSGYRKIPGNTCQGGVKKDESVWRECKGAQPVEGTVIHSVFDFSAPVVQNEFFRSSQTVLVRLLDNTVYQSANEGYSWRRLLAGESVLAFYIHPFSSDRAFLVTSTEKVHYTINRGQTWQTFNAPTPPNVFQLSAFAFHPLESDWLIWTGSKGCSGSPGLSECSAEAQYSTDNGRSWHVIDDYVRQCQWARDKDLKIDSRQILCESYRDKKGDQRIFRSNNPVQLNMGSPFYAKKKTLFNNVVGFAKFSEYLLVAEYLPQKQALDLQVSLDGKQFATGLFPPEMQPDNHAYTILESSTDSVFLHLTVSDLIDVKWGNILKSNSNGTYYSLSVEHVSRSNEGYVDFEKMIGLDGIALINVVSNPENAGITGQKQLQSRITHNDGGSWKLLNPPALDSLGSPYECSSTKCALHIHGFTERYDARATFSSPAIPGVLMGVGNVGETLAPYTDSDTFLSRNGGFVWEEIRKDAHLWEFGDSGSILVLANDEGPTDKVLYSTDEGRNWREYNFGQRIRVRSITNSPSDTSRKFILFGHLPTSNVAWIAVHIDFTALTSKRCVLNLEDPNSDDFELWSPSEERQEKCLFGRQTQYHRRIRDRNCFVGDTPLQKANIVRNCTCTKADFECEFNHVRRGDECVPIPGAQLLSLDTSWSQCSGGADFWYERTAYRKIPHSSCQDGLTLDLGTQHVCPGLKAHGFWFWTFMGVIVIGLTALFSLWWRRSGLSRGTIRLPDGATGPAPARFDDSGPLATLASIPWFVVGLAGVGWSKVSPYLSRIPFVRGRDRGRGGYRTVAVDEDAQVLRFEDEE